MRYNIGDLVADPITNTLGIIYGIFEAQYSTVYRVEWQDEQMNQRKKQDWDHYEICKITTTSN